MRTGEMRWERARNAAICIAVGVVVSAAFHFHLVRTWRSYTRWISPERLDQLGRIPPPPSYSATLLSIMVGGLVFFVAGALVPLAARTARWQAVGWLTLATSSSNFALWGLSAGSVGNLWPLSLIFITFVTAVPIFSGAALTISAEHVIRQKKEDE